MSIDETLNVALHRMHKQMDEPEVAIWLEARKQAALKVDPETAEVEWQYARTLDPYGVCRDVPEECSQIGREYFARCPKSEIWVHFDDLTNSTRNALWKKFKSKLAFPAGLHF